MFKFAKPSYPNKIRVSFTFRKFGFRDFWQITNSVLNTEQSGIFSVCNSPEILCSFVSSTTKLFAEIFCGSFILFSRVTSYLRSLLELIKNCNALNSFKSMVLQNCEPELSYIVSWYFQYAFGGVMFSILLEQGSFVRCLWIF